MSDKDKADPEFLFDDQTTHEDPDFDSLFGDTPPQNKTENDKSNRRSAKDFQPDMDALLLSAQSSMIVEGLKCLTECNFSTAKISIYSEAIKGIELCIKIIQRHPESYRKLSTIINTDIECKEVEKTAFDLYEEARHSPPETDEDRLAAYQYLRQKMIIAYRKSLVSRSISGLKKYSLLSGGLNSEKLDTLISSNDPGLQKDVAEFSYTLKIAIDLANKGEAEIKRILRGKDTNNYIVNASELLYYYYSVIRDYKNTEYYKRLYNNYTRYQIIK